MSDQSERRTSQYQADVQEDGRVVVRRHTTVTPISKTGKHMHAQSRFEHETFEYATVAEAAKVAASIMEGVAYHLTEAREQAREQREDERASRVERPEVS